MVLNAGKEAFVNSSNKWAWAVIAVMAAVVVGTIVAAQLREKPVSVNDFEECIAAGGARMESYPEQCLYKGRTYTNEAQYMPGPSPDSASSDEYVGMTEDSALLRAEKNRTPARVVERDGESLPVTMDFVEGRLNFFVKENRVYGYEVEGEGMDAPAREPVE